MNLMEFLQLIITQIGKNNLKRNREECDANNITQILTQYALLLPLCQVKNLVQDDML